MQSPNRASAESALALRRRKIEATWSPQERRNRAEEGRRRRQELLQLILSPEDTEIWAVGALADDDLQRLAG